MTYQYDPRDFDDPRIQEMISYNEELKAKYGPRQQKKTMKDVAIEIIETGTISSPFDLRDKVADYYNLSITHETIENEWFQISKVSQEVWDSFTS